MSANNMRNITFASFNLHNLQLPGAPMYARSRPYTEDEYRQKLQWQATMLRNLDADVIAFQEVWSAEALRDLFRTAELIDEYEFAFIKEGSWDGIAVAAAVRKPWQIEGQERHKAFPEAMRLIKRKKSMAEIRATDPEADTEMAEDGAEEATVVPSHEDDAVQVAISEFSRSPLRVTIRHGRARRPSVPAIDVFCAHFKSKLGTLLDDEEFRNDAIRPHRAALGTALSTIRRVSEAAALRIILNDAMRENNRPVVVLGDLNDGQYSDTLAVLNGEPTFRMYATSRAAKRSDDGLYSGVSLQQLRSLGDVYYTHDYRDVREVIDHVLVSEQFYDWSDHRLWAFRDMRFYNDHVPIKHRMATDHGVVRARFEWSPVGQALALSAASDQVAQPEAPEPVAEGSIVEPPPPPQPEPVARIGFLERLLHVLGLAPRRHSQG